MLLCAWVAAPSAWAAQIVSANVTKNGRVFDVDFVVLIEAPRDRILAIVTDYARLSELSPTVVDSRMISGSRGGRARVEVILRPCVWVVICRTLRKVTDASVSADGVVHDTVAAISDFDHARETLAIFAHGSGSRVVYRGSLAPKFFVPPLIGTWLIRNEILRDLRVTSRRVEARASE